MVDECLGIGGGMHEKQIIDYSKIKDSKSLKAVVQQVKSQNTSLSWEQAYNLTRKNHIEFNKKQLIDYLTNYCKIHDYTVHNSSLERDVDVFLHNYFHKHSVKNSIEESMSGILQELNLVEYVGKSNAIDVYKIENQERTDLPTLVVLFGIIRQLKGNLSINFHELLNGLDSVGSVFAINANGLMVKIEEILSHFPQEITYKDDGGIRLLQFKKQFSEIEIIAKIYDNASELVALG